MANEFDGFDKPTANYSKLPHQFIDYLPDIKSMAELKVLIYLLRHTWGYQEDYKKMTIDEFMNGRKTRNGGRVDGGTGLSKPSVISGIKQAIVHGFMYEFSDDFDKARVKKFYSLTSQGLKSLTSNDKDEGLKSLTVGVKDFNIRGKEVLHRTEKETLLKETLLKETLLKETLLKETKKDKQKIPNKQTVTSPEIKPITFPLSFENQILHTDKALIGQPVIIKRGDEIIEASFYKATPKRITAYPLGGGSPIIINSTSKADIVYLNGKISQVVWAKPEQSEPNMPPNQKAIYDELIETIDKDIVAASNYKLFSEVKNYAIIIDKNNIFTQGYLSYFNRWYYDIHTEWQASPSSITLKTIQTNIGAYKRWVSRGKQIPKKKGMMEGLKTPQAEVVMEVVTMTEQEMLGLAPGEEVDLSEFEWDN